jgi:hypothetical protein
MTKSLTNAVRAASVAARRLGASPSRLDAAKARWESTPEQVEAQIRAFQSFGPNSGSHAARHYEGPSSYRLVRVPIARIELDYDYGAAKYAGTRDGNDVEQLADLMRRGIPLPPASGYADATWYGPTDGLYGLMDGNHRISAAKLVGMKTVPIVIPTRGTKNPKRAAPPLTDEYVHTVLSEAVDSSRGMKLIGRAPVLGRYQLRIYEARIALHVGVLWLLFLGKELVGTGRLILDEKYAFARAGIAVVAKEYRRQGLYTAVLPILRKKLGVPIESDASMTPGAIGAWKRSGGKLTDRQGDKVFRIQNPRRNLSSAGLDALFAEEERLRGRFPNVSISAAEAATLAKRHFGDARRLPKMGYEMKLASEGRKELWISHMGAGYHLSRYYR